MRLGDVIDNVSRQSTHHPGDCLLVPDVDQVSSPPPTVRGRIDKTTAGSSSSRWRIPEVVPASRDDFQPGGSQTVESPGVHVRQDGDSSCRGKCRSPTGPGFAVTPRKPHRFCFLAHLDRTWHVTIVLAFSRPLTAARSGSWLTAVADAVDPLLGLVAA